MYLCTPIDPLFLALPVLESSRNKVLQSLAFVELIVFAGIIINHMIPGAQ